MKKGFRMHRLSMLNAILLAIVPIVSISCLNKNANNSPMVGVKVIPFKIATQISLNTSDSFKVEMTKTNILVIIDPSCPYSKAQTQEIVDNIATFRNENINFISVTSNELDKYVEKFNLNQLTNVKVGTAPADLILNILKVQTVPAIFILDNSGTIVRHYTGLTDVSYFKI